MNKYTTILALIVVLLLSPKVFAAVSSIVVTGSGQAPVGRVFFDDTALFFGIGTSTPYCFLCVAGDGVSDLFAVASSTVAGSNKPVFAINKSEHLITAGETPVVSTCGTNPAITGNDTAGKVTTGTAAPRSCTVTFSTAFATAPACILTGAPPSASQMMSHLYSSSTASQFSFMASSTGAFAAGTMTSYTISYHCIETQ